jgi:hypothetical protein
VTVESLFYLKRGMERVNETESPLAPFQACRDALVCVHTLTHYSMFRIVNGSTVHTPDVMQTGDGRRINLLRTMHVPRISPLLSLYRAAEMQSLEWPFLMIEFVAGKWNFWSKSVTSSFLQMLRFVRASHCGRLMHFNCVVEHNMKVSCRRHVCNFLNKNSKS